MSTQTYPSFHEALLKPETYPVAKRRIRFQETRHSYLYHTGEKVYLVRKTAAVDSNPALKERHTREALSIGKRFAATVYMGMIPIVKTESGYAIDQPGQVQDYALVLQQLSSSYWLDHLIGQDRFSTTMASKVARYLAENHRNPANREIPQEGGKPEHMRNLNEEIFYQVKKYIDLTVSAALVEMVAHPVFRFIETQRKLFLRRQKKRMVVACHGGFVPKHVHVKGSDVLAISPLTGPDKFRMLDGINDVATFINELQRLGLDEQTQAFLKRYESAAKDKDLPLLLPFYQTFQAMQRGLVHSESLNENDLSASQREQRIQLAQSYFELAVHCSRQIPRSA